jgi:hypothetical protein
MVANVGDSLINARRRRYVSCLRRGSAHSAPIITLAQQILYRAYMGLLPQIKGRAFSDHGLFLLVCSHLGIGLAFWQLWPAQEAVTGFCADNSKVTLLKVTYGTNPCLRYETGWREVVISRLLP